MWRHCKRRRQAEIGDMPSSKCKKDIWPQCPITRPTRLCELLSENAAPLATGWRRGSFGVGVAEGTNLVDGERSHLMKLFINFAAEDCASWRMIASVLVGA
jgi:hypothetical protein